MRSQEFIVSNLRNLSLDIYTVGYPNMGESVVSVICDGKTVLFTILTDCYTPENYNHVESLLNSLGVSHIDVFIWTHPDKDHSVGICELLDKFDSKHEAWVYLPEGFYACDIPDSICEDSRNAIVYLKEHYNFSRKFNLIPVGVDEKETRSLIVIKFVEAYGTKSVHCRWQFMAPFGSLVWRKISNGTDFVLNNLSIVYSMYFNDVNYLFCGDMSESMVKHIDDENFQNVRFIKIPHHGSDEPKSFLPKLKSMQVHNAMAVTTSFQNTHPKSNVLDGYKSICEEVDCTGDNMHATKPYGCVKASFNIHSLICHTEFSGNAFCYYKAK